MNDGNLSSGQLGQSDAGVGANAPASFAVDFSLAKKLPNTGTTCDVYDYRYLNRRYLIKRIREEHIGNPVVLAAFRKEIELGMDLRHQALPVYHFAGNDYIAMDFVDGMTLAKMIHERDPWLADMDNIRRMLSQLIDVIDYLHQKNVVHCDVKTDNVMITAGTRNLMLIDLGGAYTYSNDNSPGDPNIYGLDRARDIGNPDIDFHGVGRIVDRLIAAGFGRGKLSGLRRFRRLCDRRGVTPAQLREALQPRHYGVAIAAVAVLVASAIAAVFLLNRPASEKEEAVEAAAESDTVVNVVKEPETAPAPVESVGPTEPSKSAEQKPAKPARTLEQAIGEVLPPAIATLNPELDRYKALIADKSLSSKQLIEAATEFVDFESATMSKALDRLRAEFPDTDFTEIYKAFYGSEICTRYMKRSNAAQQEGFNETKRRARAEQSAQ